MQHWKGVFLIIIHSTVHLFFEYFKVKKIKKNFALAKWPILGLEREIYKRSLEHLFVSESTEVFKMEIKAP